MECDRCVVVSAWGKMGFLFRIFCSLILALGVGYYSARWAINEVSKSQAIANGPWLINPKIGSTQLDPYTRAGVAIGGLLALNQSEAIYFFADHDSDGALLEGNCTYSVSVENPPARWWTITAYGPDNYLMENEENRYAVSLEDTNNATLTFSIGRDVPANGVWLPIGDATRFSLTLRVYNPEPALLDNLATVPLPTIKREDCS